MKFNKSRTSLKSAKEAKNDFSAETTQKSDKEVLTEKSDEVSPDKEASAIEETAVTQEEVLAVEYTAVTNENNLTDEKTAELIEKALRKSTPPLVLEVKNFSKKYKGAKNYSALNINLQLKSGEVLGLIGSNGAGKSTTIKCITGILPFKEGQILINGYDIQKQPILAKRCIGYVPDDHSVYDKLSGKEYVDYMGSLFGVKKEEKQKRIEYLSKLFNIESAMRRQIAGYSHGMKQKICLIGSLVHSPKLWILDEPMMGLDPQTMKDVLDSIKSYALKGNAVVFSSHNLDVVEKVCDKVAIIKDGELALFLDLNNAKKEKSFSLEKVFMRINGAE